MHNYFSNETHGYFAEYVSSVMIGDNVVLQYR